MDKKPDFLSDELKELLDKIGFELFSYNQAIEYLYFKNHEYDITIKYEYYQTNSYILYLKYDYVKLYNTRNESLFISFLKDKFKGEIRKQKIKLLKF